MSGLVDSNAGRLSVSAVAVGIAQVGYEKAFAYSRKRKAFGESIANFQMVQGKLADMITGINAARLLTIAEGTSDILRLLIAHLELKQH